MVALEIPWWWGGGKAVEIAQSHGYFDNDSFQDKPFIVPLIWKNKLLLGTLFLSITIQHPIPVCTFTHSSPPLQSPCLIPHLASEYLGLLLDHFLPNTPKLRQSSLGWSFKTNAVSNTCILCKVHSTFRCIICRNQSVVKYSLFLLSFHTGCSSPAYRSLDFPGMYLHAHRCKGEGGVLEVPLPGKQKLSEKYISLIVH